MYSVKGRFMITKKLYKLYTKKTKDTLYEGQYTSFIECLESAITKGINLSGINLRNKNLCAANLDNANMADADFSNTNLTGANLSECNLSDSLFGNALLYNTYFSYSNLRNCDFRTSHFGGTDMTGTDISGSIFSNLSYTSLNFKNISSMKNCKILSESRDYVTNLTKPPLVIKGYGNLPIIIADNYVLNGHTPITKFTDTHKAENYIGRILIRSLTKANEASGLR